jgi:hypothetical protein
MAGELSAISRQRSACVAVRVKWCPWELIKPKYYAELTQHTIDAKRMLTALIQKLTAENSVLKISSILRYT